jgi:hypothetical protein
MALLEVGMETRVRHNQYVDRYVIIRKVLYCMFNTFPLFIRRFEILI